ncbi:MAG: AAA family ATPase, partial [Thermomicrobiales bacterium]
MGPNTGRPTQRPPSLPVIHTPLVGRRDAARQIAQLARSGTCRLITITGPGGMGKTRLAIHLAEHLAEDFPDGVVWVPLAAVAAPELVVPTILQNLGVHEIPGIPPLDHLLEQVQHRKLLLVLDDLEHLLASAPDLRTIVMASRDLVMLVTSQAPLDVGGERVYALPPLALPDPHASPERLLQSEAVSLFVQRARAINPYLTLTPDDADVIAAICIQLDGLPLAIELAAARTNVLTPRALLDRLGQGLNMLSSSREDLPDRLRTQRRAIAWSYGLLPEDEQRLFRWLSVFAGGIPLAVIDAFPTAADGAFALDLLTQLVERSLVTATLLPGEDPRYEMLEILRAFGHEQLALAGDEEAARAWHAAWFAACATEAGAQVLNGGQMLAMETFGREMENIRVALGWYLHHGSPGPALAISSASARFWSMRGMATEGRSWITQALAANGDQPSSLRANAYFAAGCLAADQNDLVEADRDFATSLAIAE